MNKTLMSRHGSGRRSTPSAIAVALVLCLGSSRAVSAGTITYPLTNSGTISFLSPFPNIETAGTATQPLATVLGPAAFTYDLTVHALEPNGGGSLLTGMVTFDFGNSNVFAGTLTAAASSSAPLIDPITMFRSATQTAPFTVTAGTGLFAGASGTGLLLITTQRATDTSPAGTFASTGTVSVSAPAVVPEPSLLLLGGTGLASLFAARRRIGVRNRPGR